MSKKKSDYAEKYKDPRWQKKRLQIMERDRFTCQMCFSDKDTLHVHHRYYEWGNDPWEYPDEALVTLCEGCHESETPQRSPAQKLLVSSMSKHLHAEEIARLANALDAIMRHEGCLPFMVLECIEMLATNEDFLAATWGTYVESDQARVATESETEG